MAQPKITDADIAGMDDLFGPPPPPLTPRSPLRDLNPPANAMSLFGSSLLRGAGVSSPRSPVRYLNPPRPPARREFSPTAADVADADAALKKMEAELAATLEPPPPPPAPASSPQRGKPRLSYASARDLARRARGGQRPATMLRDVATVRPSLGDPAPGPARPLLTKKRPSPQPKRAAPKKKKKTTTTTTDEKGADRPDRRTEKYRASRRVPATNPNARGPIRNWPIDAGATKEFIPKLQKYLKEHPDGGDAMAKKVEGWGAFKNGHRGTCYVDPDANNGEGACYRTKPEIVRALKAEASA